jgi:hypothetical protein
MPQAQPAPQQPEEEQPKSVRAFEVHMKSKRSGIEHRGMVFAANIEEGSKIASEVWSEDNFILGFEDVTVRMLRFS